MGSRFHSGAAWLASAALLAGCVTAPAPISGERKLTGDEGAVVFKFITNGITANDPAETLSSITLKREVPPGVRETSQDTTVLSRTRAVTNTTALFSGMVAPGRYRVLHATGFAGNTTYTFPLARMLTEFEVKKGEVSSLGTLVVEPLEGSRFTVGHVPPDVELAETFEALFPALAQQTRGRAPNTFAPSVELLKRQALARQIRNYTAAPNGVKIGTDGAVLAGGKMGRIIWRKPGAARFQALGMDTWKEVLSVRAYRGGMLAAGEEGLLRYSNDEGRTWQSLPPPDRGLIAAAEPLPNGKVLALVRRDATWTAYASEDPLAGAWRRIGSFDQERSLNVPGQTPIVLSTGSGVGVLMPNGVFQVVDGETETIARRSTGVSTFQAHTTADGSLVVRGGTMTAGVLVSADAGKTWTDLNVSRFVQAMTLADPHTAYAIAPVDPGIFPGKFALMVSRDAAKTWKQAGEVPGGLPYATRALLYDRADSSLLAFMQNGQVMRSLDEGKTWTRSF